MKKPSPDQDVAAKPEPSAVPDEDSSVVRKPSISIRESLHGALRQSGEAAVGTSSDQGKQEPPEVPEGGENQSDMAMSVEPDQILSAWKAFAASVEKSQPRVHATLINNLPEIKPDGTLQVTLNSEAQRENFTKNIKHRLMAYMARATGSGSFEIETRVQEAANNGKRMYTEQDKLDYLMKKNPDLGRLKSRFNLDFDD